MIRYLLLCDAYDDVHDIELPGSDVRRRVNRNQDERYHRLEAGAGLQDPAVEVPADLFLDFKKTFMVPVDGLYEAIE